MAHNERVSLRGIHREIRTAARKLRTARRHADKSHYSHLDALAKQLEDMEKSTTAMCGRVYGVWPPPPAKPPAKPKPKPGKPGKPGKGTRRKPARPKKGR